MESVPYVEGECVLHKSHYPRPRELHKHHIYPTGVATENGWPTVAETILVCPTGHVNIHNLIRMFVHGQAYRGRGGKTYQYAMKAIAWIKEHDNFKGLGAQEST